MKICELIENDDKHFKTLYNTGMWGEHAAGCILLANDTKKIGLVHRSKYVQSPNTLGTIGGAVDEGDDTIVTTKKEVNEEVGYYGPLELIPLLKAEIKTRSDSIFTYQNYLGIVPQQFNGTMNWENEALIWLTLDELLNYSGNIVLHRGIRMLLNDVRSVDIIKKHVNLTESIVNETATDILYYYRQFRGTLGILNDGYFSLSSVTGNSEEEKLAPPGKPYFLSTTRSKVGDYHRYVGNTAAMFVLDGRYISQRYEVKPVDYWYTVPKNLKKGEWRTLDRTAKKPTWDFAGSQRTSESEDRIYSNKHTMSLAPIMSLHLYYNLEKLKDVDEHFGYRGAMLHQIILRCQELNIPVYVYGNESDWRLQNKSKALSISYVLDLTKDLSIPKSEYVPSRFLDNLVELIVKDDKSDLSKEADRLRYNISYYSDTYKSISNDMHNARKPGNPDYENVILINKYMISNKLNYVKDLVNHLKNKWSAIQ